MAEAETARDSEGGSVMIRLWIYATLRKGRLVDEDGYELNESWPDFVSIEDAERFLEENDIRASVRDED